MFIMQAPITTKKLEAPTFIAQSITLVDKDDGARKTLQLVDGDEMRQRQILLLIFWRLVDLVHCATPLLVELQGS